MKKNKQKKIVFLKKRAKRSFLNNIRRKKKEYDPEKYVLNSSENGRFSSSVFYEDIKAPKKFNLQYENCNAVIHFVAKIKKLGKRRKSINIIMEDIEEIGEGAIAMLLSVMDELSKKGIRIKGSKPKPGLARDILEKSGFFLFTQGSVDPKNNNTKNTILKTGGVSPKRGLISSEIQKANETVWKQRGRNPPLRGTVYEMMRNSCDHAFNSKNKIIWHFAISHEEEENLVKFSFVDNGRGIIKSLHTSFLSNAIGVFKDNSDLLEEAFRDGIESRTGLSWRGKGLPTIFENYEEGYFKSFIVISNDVFIDFDRKVFKKLDIPFSGTYYFWILNQECIKACFN